MPEIETSDKITPFLVFDGAAEEAIEFYTSLFDGSGIVAIDRYGPDGAGAEGTVERATFTLAGAPFTAIDSSEDHDFGFTPAISLFVRCDEEAEIDELYGAFSESGRVLMPLDAYPFSRKFGWVEDRYGVSWQLNLD